MEAVKLKDEGYAQIEIDGFSTTIDVAEAFNFLVEASAKHQGNATAYLAAVREWLVSKGYPSCSLGLCDHFARAIFSLKEKMVANFTPPPSSSASTASP